MKVTFDTEGVTMECPEKGLATSADCWDCLYFVESEGFDVICSYPDQEPTEEEE